LALAQAAYSRLGLDEVWLLVSPQNPLKPKKGMAPFKERLTMCALMAEDTPWLKASDFENRIHSAFTYHTLLALKKAYPDVLFVWLMGTDNLRTFHRWEAWGRIFRTVPIAVVNRGDAPYAGLRSPAAIRFARWRRRAVTAPLDDGLPNWRVLFVPVHEGRATDIRTRLRQGAAVADMHPRVLERIRLKNTYGTTTIEGGGG
jgi:nicotinate-nucleotide adenylyltransferase